MLIIKRKSKKKSDIKNMAINKISGNIIKGKNIIINQNIKQKNNDSSKYKSKNKSKKYKSKYNIGHQNTFVIEKLSIYMFNKFGERNLIISVVISLMMSILAFILKNYYALGFFGIVFLIILVILKYKDNSKCSKCNKFWAMKEHGQPKQEETRVKGGTMVNTTRYYKCKYCGFQNTKKYSRFFSDEESV